MARLTVTFTDGSTASQNYDDANALIDVLGLILYRGTVHSLTLDNTNPAIGRPIPIERSRKS